MKPYVTTLLLKDGLGIGGWRPPRGVEKLDVLAAAAFLSYDVLPSGDY